LTEYGNGLEGTPGHPKHARHAKQPQDSASTAAPSSSFAQDAPAYAADVPRAAASPLPADSPTAHHPSQQEVRNLTHREHHKRRLPIVARILLVVVAIVAVAGVAAAAWVGHLNSSMSVGGSEGQQLSNALKKPASGKKDAPFYMVIIGSDNRSGVAGSRSDVTMLARVDLAHSTVTLVSIPRDTMVRASNGSTEKINAEYNNGPAATVEAVSKFAGVPITHYMAMSFDDLAGVIDRLGGVTVNVPEAFTSRDGYRFTKGDQNISGAEAFSYVRDRYNESGGDFGRAQAQRQVVEAIARKTLESPVTELPGVVESLAGSVSTDLSVTDLVSWATTVKGSGIRLKVYSAVVPSYSLSQDGVSYVGTMYNEWRAMMQRVDAGMDPNDANAQVPRAQASNTALGAAENATSPKDYQQLAANAGLTTNDVAQ
jgi:LCP family protein required for cell wall assembly